MCKIGKQFLSFTGRYSHLGPFPGDNLISPQMSVESLCRGSTIIGVLTRKRRSRSTWPSEIQINVDRTCVYTSNTQHECGSKSAVCQFHTIWTPEVDIDPN